MSNVSHSSSVVKGRAAALSQQELLDLVRDANGALQIVFLCAEITESYPREARGLVPHAQAAARRLAGIVNQIWEQYPAAG
jgi:hypothetical protein